MQRTSSKQQLLAGNSPTSYGSTKENSSSPSGWGDVTHITSDQQLRTKSDGNSVSELSEIEESNHLNDRSIHNYSNDEEEGIPLRPTAFDENFQKELREFINKNYCVCSKSHLCNWVVGSFAAGCALVVLGVVIAAGIFFWAFDLNNVDLNKHLQ